MNKKLMRGSLFICLMFIISISLTGCDIDLGKIVSGVKNTLGKVAEGVGNIIQKAVPVVKNVVDAVKPVVSSVADAISSFTGKSNKITETFDKVVGKVDNILDKASGIGEKLVETGKSWQTDSAGNAASGTAEVGQGVADPTADTPVAVSSTNTGTSTNTNTNTNTGTSTNTNTNTNTGTSTNTGTNTNNDSYLRDLAQRTKDMLGDNAKVELIYKDGKTEEVKANTNLTAVNDELLTEDEKIHYTNELRKEFEQMEKDVNTIKGLVYSSSKGSKDETIKPMIAKIDDCLKDIEAIRKNPATAESEKKYKALLPKLSGIKKEINNLSNAAEFMKDGMKEMIMYVEDAVNAIDNAFGKLNTGKK